MAAEKSKLVELVRKKPVEINDNWDWESQKWFMDEERLDNVMVNTKEGTIPDTIPNKDDSVEVRYASELQDYLELYLILMMSKKQVNYLT